MINKGVYKTSNPLKGLNHQFQIISHSHDASENYCHLKNSRRPQADVNAHVGNLF